MIDIVHSQVACAGFGDAKADRGARAARADQQYRLVGEPVAATSHTFYEACAIEVVGT
ncbi:hypothetical protein D3C84_1001180 [compost metagenome]